MKETRIRSKGELVDDLAALALKINRLPNYGDIFREHKDGKCAHPSTYSQRFDGLENATERLREREETKKFFSAEQLSLV